MNHNKNLLKMAPVLVTVPMILILVAVQSISIMNAMGILLVLNAAAVSLNLTGIILSYHKKNFGLQLDCTGVIFALIAILISVMLI